MLIRRRIRNGTGPAVFGAKPLRRCGREGSGHGGPRAGEPGGRFGDGRYRARGGRRGGPAGYQAMLGSAFPRTRHVLFLEFGDPRDFDDPHKEWRRLFSELLGTFALVLAAAGGGLLHAKGQIGLARRSSRRA